MTEPIEVKLARVEEQSKLIREDMSLARDSRKQQYEALESISRSLIRLESRVEGVEKSLAAAAPTIDEFVNIKLKVQGAGLAGRWAWFIGASVITFLYSIRETLITWIAKQ